MRLLATNLGKIVSNKLGEEEDWEEDNQELMRTGLSCFGNSFTIFISIKLTLSSLP
jgi:hypothetical protein